MLRHLLIMALCFAGGMALGLVAQGALFRPAAPPPAHSQEEIRSPAPQGIEAPNLELLAFPAGIPS